MARCIETLRAQSVPRFRLEELPIDLEFPVDFQDLPLGVIVGAGKADAARFRLNGLHEPAARTHLDQFSHIREAFRQLSGSIFQGCCLQRRGQVYNGRNRNFTSEARRMGHEFSLADA